MNRFETLEGKIVIVITGKGLVIGEMAEGELTAPRILMTTRGDGERAGVILSEMIGSPTVMQINNAVFYVSENDELNTYYKDAVKEPSSIIRVS